MVNIDYIRKQPYQRMLIKVRGALQHVRINITRMFVVPTSAGTQVLSYCLLLNKNVASSHNVPLVKTNDVADDNNNIIIVNP